MNTQYFLYALEIQKTGSITQAASNLYMSQPTLSKAIKDLEATLGFTVFRRGSRGVIPTQKGEEFLVHAQKIATHLQTMEMCLNAHDASHQLFSIAIPRVSYIAQAASEYICSFDSDKDMEIDLCETTSVRVIEDVAYGHFVLGLIRYHTEDEDYFLKSLAEKNLQYESIWRSEYVALMHKDHPLASRKTLRTEELAEYIEITFGDEEVPYIRTSQSNTVSPEPHSTKRILVYDRATQFDLLRNNPLAYMWVSPVPRDLLKDNNLVQIRCEHSRTFADALICRSGYRYSKLDREFIDILYLQRNKVAFDS